VGDAEAVGERRDPLGLVDAHLRTEVGAVKADGCGGRRGETVAEEQEGDRDGIKGEVADVHDCQLPNCNHLEEDCVADKGAVSEAIAAVEVGHVHAVVDEGGGKEEEVAVGEDKGIDEGACGNVEDVGEAEVLLREEHDLGACQDDEGADLGGEALGLDGAEEKGTCSVVVAVGEVCEVAAVGLQALGVERSGS